MRGGGGGSIGRGGDDTIWIGKREERVISDRRNMCTQTSGPHCCPHQRQPTTKQPDG